MGDHLTQPIQSAALQRARFLKAALQSGARPALSHAEGEIEETPASPSQIEANLDLQRTYLDQLIENAPGAISILDAQYRILRINSEFTRLFGYTTEEAVGRVLNQLLVPADRMTESNSMAEALAQGQKVSVETQRLRKDGSLVDVSILGTPVNVYGGPVAIFAMYRDISQRKRAETISSALYRIAEKASVAEDLNEFYAVIHGILGELMYARNFYIALYDSNSKTLSFPYFVDEHEVAPKPRKLGRGVTEYVLRSGEPLLATSARFEELARGGEVDPIGSPVVDWLGVPLKVGNEALGVVAVRSYRPDLRFGEEEREILTFVSHQLASAIDHKRHEEALRRSEARYRSLVESAVYGICRTTLDGRFLDVNPAIVSMLGYERAEQLLALDPKHDLFLYPEEQGRLARECARRGRLDNFEMQWKRKDKSAITVRLSGRAVTSVEEPQHILELIAEDVSEKRVLEDQFRQAQKMEAVGRLAGGVAHDFNNLLMVISGYTEVLLEKLENGGTLHSKAAAIQQASDRATTLTRQLLAFSRKQLLELKVVDVNTIVSDMERLLRPLIGENIQLTTKLGAGLGRTRADAGQLEQVIMNLVVNAKDAMPEGGKIIIRTANTELDDTYRREHAYIQPGPYVMLSVSDSGCGMDQQTLSRIFEPFFTTKEKGKGTGLGLSTVYGIVKQSGGYIFAQSEPGHGTTFRIYLPRVDDRAEVASTVRSPETATCGTETILLVEDEESVRQLVKETLESRGYTVIEAGDGEAALQLALSRPEAIHLMITDVVMPGISGHELAQQLAKTHPSTKVLFLSGYTEDAVANPGALEHEGAFLQKPFTLQNLARKVREVLRTT